MIPFSAPPKLGVMYANSARSSEPEHALALAVSAEELGFESLWAVQHVAVPAGPSAAYPYAGDGGMPGGEEVAIPDPMVWLAWVGAATSRIRLATGVLVLPQQHPLVIAKQAATLDRLTGGRLILGVGAGWLKDEFDVLGVDFGSRVKRMEESIEAMRRAWDQGPAEMAGEHVAFRPVHVEPSPTSPIPIHLGGHAEVAARRAGRIGDGFFPMKLQGEELERIVLATRDAAERAGRDPAIVEITTLAPRDLAEAEVQARLGVDRVVVSAPRVPYGELRDSLADRRDRVLAIAQGALV